MDLLGFRFPYTLSGVVNEKPTAMACVSIYDADKYVESLDWYMKREGGRYNLTLYRSDGPVKHYRHKFVGDRNAKTIGDLNED
jgi:hypothetical protein